MNRVPAQAFYDEGPDDRVDGDVIASGAIYSPIYHPSYGESLDSWRYEFVKRGFDIVLAMAMLTLLAVPGLLIAAAILLTSKGGVFYTEQRIGRNGQMFKIWKFRSMHRNAERVARAISEQHHGNILPFRMRKHRRDPRITAIGRFLRCWSLDEIPQVFNVLRGEMSLIGPRPIVEAEASLYERWLPYYLAVRPGISGLWQVSGRSNVDYPKRAEIDATYVRTWSLWGDFAIVLQTIPAVLSRTGAR